MIAVGATIVLLAVIGVLVLAAKGSADDAYHLAAAGGTPGSTNAKKGGERSERAYAGHLSGEKSDARPPESV